MARSCPAQFVSGICKTSLAHTRSFGDKEASIYRRITVLLGIFVACRSWNARVGQISVLPHPSFYPISNFLVMLAREHRVRIVKSIDRLRILCSGLIQRCTFKLMFGLIRSSYIFCHYYPPRHVITSDRFERFFKTLERSFDAKHQEGPRLFRRQTENFWGL